MIDFDAENKTWKDYLESQPTQYGSFFKHPMSPQGMEYFKKMLELINKRAVKTGTMQGVFKFVNSVQDKKSKALMLTWLDTYSPIRARVTKSGQEEWLLIRDYRARCNLVDGITNPFYLLTEKPRKLHRGQARTGENAIFKAEDLMSVDSPARTELDLQKKLVKTSVNRFLSDRSVENRLKLIAAINAIPLGDSLKGGQVFLQGGAVGLKR